uniref:Serpin domain-containing protein n=1 Tax=Ditylenchus dipsaci TaxID=166011 RepID=A0A915E1P8_9BILA
MRSLERMSPHNCQLLMTNRAYLSIGRDLHGNFANTIQDSYSFDKETVNFEDATNAAKTINEFVGKATNFMLPAIFSADDIDSTTCLLLLSVLYFKGSWAFGPFDIDCTQKAIFNNLDGRKTEVDTMYGNISVPYYGNDQIQVLCLPYSSPDLS